MSSQLSISRSSLQRVYKSLGYKPYIPRLVHELNEDDFDRRVEYCETFLSLLQNEPDLIYRVMWSDEAIFKLNGHINRHNSTYWATENPNVTWEHTMQAAGFTVWTCIWSEGVIGPYFFEDTVTAQSYLTMLNNYFYPVYRDLSDNESIFLCKMARQRIMLMMFEIGLTKIFQQGGLDVEVQSTGLQDLLISVQPTSFYGDISKISCTKATLEPDLISSNQSSQPFQH